MDAYITLSLPIISLLPLDYEQLAYGAYEKWKEAEKIGVTQRYISACEGVYNLCYNAWHSEQQDSCFRCDLPKLTVLQCSLLNALIQHHIVFEKGN